MAQPVGAAWPPAELLSEVDEVAGGRARESARRFTCVRARVPVASFTCVGVRVGVCVGRALKPTVSREPEDVFMRFLAVSLTSEY